MNSQCVAYVTDVDYSFPTILSALQVRKFTSATTDVCVLMSERLKNFGELEALLAISDVKLIDATSALQEKLGKLDDAHFQGRISVSTMAKLILPQVLDRASARALGFVARRLLAERIALLFGARQLGDALGGFPELPVGPLGHRDAHALWRRPCRLGWMSACWSGSLSRPGGIRWPCWSCRAG